MEDEPKPGWAFLALFFAPLFGLPLLLAGLLALGSDVTGSIDLSKAENSDQATGPAPKTKFVYVPIVRDIDISLPNNLGRLRAEVVAVMTEANQKVVQSRIGADLRDASTSLMETAASFAEELHEDGRLDSGLATLRAELPAKVRDAINSELERFELGDAIREVLIMKWNVAPPFERTD